MSGGGGEQTVGYRYYMGLHMGLCAGPVDSLLKITIGDRDAWSGTVTASGQINIDAPELFGGEEREGGVLGPLDVMMGEPTQAANSYLTARQSGPQPAYRGLLGLVFRQGLVACNNPYIKPWAFKLARVLKGWQGDAPWYPEKAAITLPSGDKAMNPVHIVYECLTNQEWGAGNGTSLIDDANFRAAADICHAEGLGLCMQWLRQEPIDGFVQIVCDHAGMNLGQDRRTGLFVLRMLRGGYDASTLPLYDESSVLAVESYQRPATAEQVNELTVKFDDLATGKTGSVTVQNLANITSQGGAVSQTKNYPGLPTADLAIRAALRDLRVVSSPLAKLRLRVNRKGYNLLPGDLIRLSWAKLGLTAMVLRVLQVNAGTVTDGAIQVDCVEDVFGFPATSYAAQQPTGWAQPNNAPAIAPYRLVREASYYELVREMGADAANAVPVDAGYVVACAVRPSSDARDFAMLTSPGGAYQRQARETFCPTGVLAADLSHTATAATIGAMVDVDLVELGGYAQIGEEMVRVDAVNSGTGALTIGRAVMGTVAAKHLAGARVWFRDGYTAADLTERVDGETVAVKLLTATGLGELAEASAPANSVTLDQLAARPFPPGQLRIAGQTYPAELSNTAPALTWVHRNRQQQNLEGDETGSIGPEAGTTYAVEFRNVDTGAVIRTATGISGTGYSASDVYADCTLGVRVWSVRDGLDSAQRHDWTFDFFNPTPAIAPGATLVMSAQVFVGPAWNGGATAPGGPMSVGASLRRGTAYAETASSVLLHLRMDGASGSTTFVDASTHAHTITAVRNAQVTTSDRLIGSGALELTHGATNLDGDHLVVGSIGTTPAAFDGFFTRDWTIEGWAKFDTSEGGTLFSIAVQDPDLSFRGVLIGFSRRYPEDPEFFINNNQFNGATKAPVGSWFHFAIVSSERGKVRCYVNGRNDASFYGTPGDVNPQDYYQVYGDLPAGASPAVGGRGVVMDGRIDEFKITNYAKYTDDFACAAVTGRAWADTNGDGNQGAGETAGKAGVTVDLKVGATTIRTTTTDAEGRFYFFELPAGTYSVHFTAPADHTVSTASTVGPQALANGGVFEANAGIYKPSVTVFHASFVGANGSKPSTEYTGKTITYTGDSALSTANYKFPTSSLYLDGSGDYVSSTGTALNLSSTDYTVAAWVYIDRTSWGAQSDTLFSTYLDQAYGRTNLVIEANGVVQFSEQDADGTNTNYVQTASGVISLQTWHYVEISKQGTTGRVFVDGDLKATLTSAVRTSFTGYMRVGALDPASGAYAFYLKGYVQDLLVCKTALHTANYTPPAALLEYPVV